MYCGGIDEAGPHAVALVECLLHLCDEPVQRRVLSSQGVGLGWVGFGRLARLGLGWLWGLELGYQLCV